MIIDDIDAGKFDLMMIISKIHDSYTTNADEWWLMMVIGAELAPLQPFAHIFSSRLGDGGYYESRLPQSLTLHVLQGTTTNGNLNHWCGTSGFGST